MVNYVKGSKPQDLDAAKGGLVLARNRNFVKAENDDMHPLGTGLNGPENSQSYSKKGAHGSRSAPTGNKSLSLP